MSIVTTERPWLVVSNFPLARTTDPHAVEKGIQNGVCHSRFNRLEVVVLYDLDRHTLHNLALRVGRWLGSPHYPSTHD